MSRADALALAGRGWPVFPTREKKPLTPNGFKDATTQPPEDWPEDAQVAIAVPLDKIVVDIDTADGTDKHPDDGFATLAALEAEFKPLPPTLTSVSGRGGEHRWFRAPVGVELYQRNIGPGIQTRVGGKGYVVAPPSIHHENGQPYRWKDVNAPIADAPGWILGRLITRKEQESPKSSAGWPTPSTDALVAARKWLADAPLSIQGQDGSGALMKAAGVLVRGFALGPTIGGELVREYNSTKAEPKWSESEIARAISNAATSTREPAVGSMLLDVDLLAAIHAGSRVESVTQSVFDIDDICAELPPIDYLVSGIGITKGAPAMIAGYGYSGKTAATQQISIDLARADHTGAWMNKRPVWGKFAGGRRARVLHLDYEQGPYLTRVRYQRLMRAAGIDREALRGHLRLVYPSYYTNNAKGYAELERAVDGFDLVIVDSFRAANPGLEENSSDAREPLDAMARLSNKYGCAFLVIHHARKPQKDSSGGAKMAIRGSGALFDAPASVLVFDAPEKDGPKHVSHEKERNSGKTEDDFDIVIEDHNGGFRARAVDVVVKTAEDRAAEQTKEDVAKLRTYLEKHIYFTSRDEPRVALAISTSRIGAAIGAMLMAGELVNDGTHNRPSYHLSGIKK